MRIKDSSVALLLKTLRWYYRRAAVVIQHGTLRDVPILFANAFPKSGTHLLIQVLQGFTKLGPAVNAGLPAITNFDGPTGKQKPTPWILKEIRRLRFGDIAYGHLHAEPEVVAELTSKNFCSFFVFRDPRDVVVSHVHYVTEIETHHVHHDYYVRELKTFEERLEVSILGRERLENPFPNIGGRFAPYLDWLGKPQVLSLRFEDLIETRKESIREILNHAVVRGFPLKIPMGKSIQILDSSIQPEKSPTFRSGTIGRWQDKFTAYHKSIFKEAAGDLLIQLGYEKNNDW